MGLWLLLLPLAGSVGAWEDSVGCGIFRCPANAYCDRRRPLPVCVCLPSYIPVKRSCLPPKGAAKPWPPWPPVKGVPGPPGPPGPPGGGCQGHAFKRYPGHQVARPAAVHFGYIPLSGVGEPGNSIPPQANHSAESLLCLKLCKNDPWCEVAEYRPENSTRVPGDCDGTGQPSSDGGVCFIFGAWRLARNSSLAYLPVESTLRRAEPGVVVWLRGPCHDRCCLRYGVGPEEAFAGAPLAQVQERVMSLEACSTLCQFTANCTTGVYNSSASACSLYAGALTEAQAKAVSTDSVAYPGGEAKKEVDGFVGAFCEPPFSQQPSSHNACTTSSTSSTTSSSTSSTTSSSSSSASSSTTSSSSSTTTSSTSSSSSSSSSTSTSTTSTPPVTSTKNGNTDGSTDSNTDAQTTDANTDSSATPSTSSSTTTTTTSSPAATTSTTPSPAPTTTTSPGQPTTTNIPGSTVNKGNPPYCDPPSDERLKDPIEVKTLLVIDHHAVAKFGEAKAKELVLNATRIANEYFSRNMPVVYELMLFTMPVFVLTEENALPSALGTKGQIDIIQMAGEVIMSYGQLLLNNDMLHHVVFFTGLEREDFNVTQRNILGLSPLNGMCTQNAMSLMVLHDTDADTDLGATLAHEFAHNVGLTHDGLNGCPDDEPLQLMSPGAPIGSKTWSECSMQQFLKKVGCFGCLLGTDATPLPRTRKTAADTGDDGEVPPENTSGHFEDGDTFIGPTINATALAENADKDLAMILAEAEGRDFCDPAKAKCWLDLHEHN